MSPIPSTSQSLEEDQVELPPIHIMAGGIHALPYARFAAECLWHSCPEELRNKLQIIIGVFAIPKELMADATRFLEAVPCVSVLLNPVKVPLKIFNLPQGYTRHRISKVLRITRQVFDRMGIPPAIQIRLSPRVNGGFAQYHQEYFIRVCHLERNRSSICIVDADFFISDPHFFAELVKKPAKNIFASAWTERPACGASLNGKTYYPVGTECVRLTPKIFNRLNWQVQTPDDPLQNRLIKRHPGIKFQRKVVDTIYQFCWEAQIEGMKTECSFKDIQVCHVGGFGHSRVEYIKDCLKSPADGAGGQFREGDDAQFWIQRIRLNQRVATELATRYPLPWVRSGLDLIQNRAESAWKVPEIVELRDKTSLSNDELMFEKIVAGMKH